MDELVHAGFCGSVYPCPVFVQGAIQSIGYRHLPQEGDTRCW